MAILDTFTDTNGTLLESHTPSGGGTWTRHVNSLSSLSIIDNMVRATTNNEGHYYHSFTPATASYVVEADLFYKAAAADNFMIVARQDTASDDAYRLIFNPAVPQFIFTRVVGGASTTIGSLNMSLTVGQTYHLKLVCTNALKACYVDGVLIAASNDNLITATGKAGVRIFGSATSTTTGCWLDNFAVEDWEAPTTFQAKVGSFTKSTAAATVIQSISGIGFRPNVVLFASTMQTSLNTWSIDAFTALGYGAQTATTLAERCLSWGAYDFNANSATNRMFSSHKCINFHTANGTTTSNLVAQADLYSFDDDGFSLAWTKNNASAYHIVYLAMSVPAVAVAAFTSSTTGSGSITGVGFDPVALMVIAGAGTGYQTTAPTVTLHGSIGAAAEGSGQWAAAASSSSGGSATNSATYAASDGIQVGATSFGGGSAVTHKVALTSFDADGITYNLPSFANARIMEFLFFGGISSFAETFNKSTGAATAVQSRTGYGFTPNAALVITTSKATSATGTDHIRYSIGFTDGSGEYATLMYDTDAADPTNANSYLSNSKGILQNNSDADAISSEADISLDSDGMTFSWTTNDANAFEVMVLALGNIPAPPSTTVLPQIFQYI